MTCSRHVLLSEVRQTLMQSQSMTQSSRTETLAVGHSLYRTGVVCPAPEDSRPLSAGRRRFPSTAHELS